MRKAQMRSPAIALISCDVDESTSSSAAKLFVMKAPLKQIALAFPMGVSHLERVAFGIHRYAQEQGDWLLVSNPERHHLSLSDLKGWQGDGLVAFLTNAEEVALAQELKLPLVNLSGALADTAFPRVRMDYAAMGRLAAEHFLKRGFSHFAYYGVLDLWYAAEIGRGFAEALAAEGFELHRHDSPSALDPRSHWIQDGSAFAAWLQALPRPCALLCAQDQRGVHAVHTCFRSGLRVPQDIAVLGCNNDGISCEMLSPTLSSVARAGDDLGYAAARLLHQLMQGIQAPATDLVFPPGKVIERDSTATLVLDDPELQKAVAYIRANIAASLNVASICTYLGRSRRWLEYAFRKELDCTPLDFILQSRVQAATRMLRQQPKAKLGAIASNCGFSSPAQMQRAFKKMGGGTKE